MKIEPGANGNDVVWSELDGRAAPLQTEDVYIQLGTGHAFVGGDPRELRRHLARLRPHEIGMIEFWLKKRGDDVKPVLFAGEPDG